MIQPYFKAATQPGVIALVVAPEFQSVLTGYDRSAKKGGHDRVGAVRLRGTVEGRVDRRRRSRDRCCGMSTRDRRSASGCGSGAAAERLGCPLHGLLLGEALGQEGVHQ